MTQPKNFYLSILFLRGEESWVAQCLEYDIAAQGKTIKEAKRAFERTFVGQIVLDIHQEKEPLQGIAQAPKMYWEKFEEAEILEGRKSFRLPEGIPPGFIIAAAQDQRICA